MLLLLFDNAVNVNLELFGSGHMSHILGNKGPHNVEIWMEVSVGFSIAMEDWSTKMHSLNGCGCLTDSYFDPPVVGEIDHLHWDQRSR